MNTKLNNIFDSFDQNNIFKNKSLLQLNYQPKEILHRDKQIEQIALVLAPVLRGEKTSNLFLYGKTGTGKTLSIQRVKEELLKRSEKNNTFKLKIEYLNCKLKKVSDTEYRILAELIKKLGGEVPSTGLPTQTVYSKFIDLVDSEKQLLVLILDEIDPRVRSSLSEEEIVFPPYNAIQLQDILKKRCVEVFKDSVVQEGVIAKCSAFAAREHGDARRALDLLRIAGELAERQNSKKIFLKLKCLSSSIILPIVSVVLTLSVVCTLTTFSFVLISSRITKAFSSPPYRAISTPR